MGQSVTYRLEEITKEVLDTIKPGDLVKCNTWKRSLRVTAISENYFVAFSNAFGRGIYSVCEKKPSNITHNDRLAGAFTIGADFWLFGYYSCAGYEEHSPEWWKEYLGTWESGITKFSRRAVSLREITIHYI